MIISPLEKKKGYKSFENVYMINAPHREKEVDKISFS